MTPNRDTLAAATHIDGDTLVAVAGVRHLQQLTTIRCQFPAEQRDAAERLTRAHGHRIAWAVALPLSKWRADVTIEPGEFVVFIDREGREHVLRLHRVPLAREVRVEIVAGPLWRLRPSTLTT